MHPQTSQTPNPDFPRFPIGNPQESTLKYQPVSVSCISLAIIYECRRCGFNIGTHPIRPGRITLTTHSISASSLGRRRAFFWGEKDTGQIWGKSGFGVWGGLGGGHLYCKFHWKNSPIAPYNYSALFCNSTFWISRWENPNPLIVLGFRIWGRVHDSPN